MLGTLNSEDKIYWKDFVKFLVFVYNVIKNEVIGYSFYYLMFGREFKLI